jgi:hypothetical protein
VGLDADTGLTEGSDELFETQVVALAGDKDVVKTAAASLESLFDRVYSVQDFHTI